MRRAPRRRLAPDRAAALLSLLLCPAVAAATDPSTADAESPRSPRRLLETPLSISVVSREEFLRDRPALGFEDALDLVPGAFAESSLNFAQDTRLSIRGFGARSPFGARGLRVFMDDVPATLPDGQTEVDSLDLSFAERIEVIRGPVGSLYGGAAGGAVRIDTLRPTVDPVLRLRTLFGSDHLSRYESSFTGSLGETGLVLAAARTRYSGHRDHDRALQTAFLAKLERELAPGTELGLRFSGVWAPEAQDPGALTQEELEADPGASHPSARRFDAGEELHQQQGALTLRHHFTPAREVRGMLYRTERSFENALLFEPRGRVDLDRSVTGGSLVYTDRWRRLGVLVGADADVQADLRSRWDNVNGARGALRLRQSETVRALGPFAELDLDLGGGLGLVGGLRYDWIEFRVGDRHVTPGSVDPEDADQSGAIRYRELSPRIGIRFGRSSSLHAYANFTTSFEVPTTTELSPASGVGGFDRSLEPERAAGLEAGLKGILAERLVYDLAGFTLRVHDALVPFEDSSGRTFFRNSGRVDRHGFEAGLSAVLHPWAQLRLAYTWIDARYHDFDVLDGGVWIEHDGNREPNIPRHNLTAELRFDHPSGIFAVLALHSRSSLPLDDANTEKEDAVTFSDLRAGYEWPRGRLLFRPFVGVRNWTDELYAGTIRPNAAFRRYVEPAPGIQAYAGVSVELGP